VADRPHLPCPARRLEIRPTAQRAIHKQFAAGSRRRVRVRGVRLYRPPAKEAQAPPTSAPRAATPPWRAVDGVVARSGQVCGSGSAIPRTPSTIGTCATWRNSFLQPRRAMTHLERRLSACIAGRRSRRGIVARRNAALRARADGGFRHPA
jgi:hypothetical protein